MYRWLYANALSRLDAEMIHQRAVDGLALTARLAPDVLRAAFAPREVSGLAVDALGLRFAHPLGLAAGFDKDARVIAATAALGFSFTEVGTVTPEPQPGNDRPRLFRLHNDSALINRMGFPSAGAARTAANLQGAHAIPIGISLGKNKTTPNERALGDYAAVLEALYAHGDFFVVNVSSPNTPDLRRLQTPEYFDGLLAGLRARIDAQPIRKPLLVKLSPDLEAHAVETIVELALTHNLAGIIATNTTTERANLKSRAAAETGGLSGVPLRARSTTLIAHLRRLAGDRLTLIGVGGVFSGDDVWEKLCAGASLVQAYTGFIYEGPMFVRRVVRGLHARMEREGVRDLRDIIGTSARG